MVGASNPPVDLNLIAGLPYNRRIRITNAALIWPTTDDFEVRSQIRAGRSVSSQFLFDLRPYLMPTIEGTDIVIDLELTGADTRMVPKGYFDVIISDPGITDERAIQSISGKIKVGSLVTAADDE